MAPQTIKVKPNPDKKVNGRAVQVDHPYQTGRKINTNGEEMQDCPYLQKQLKDGDLVLCEGKKPAPPKPSSTPSHQPKKKTVDQAKKKTVD